MPTFEDELRYVERLPSSVNGNPRFRVHFKEHGTFTTQSDASVNYDVENLAAEARRSDVFVHVQTTRAGRVVYLERI